MANQLTAGQASGTQAGTQNPQAISSSNGGDEQASGVQPGTASTLLTSPNGVALNPVAVPTVSLGNTLQSSSSQTTPTAVVSHHHVDTTFLIIPGLLIVVAIVAFWATSRSVKNTTYY